MKTKNNIQKTALKSVAAATGLAIISLTVNAQGALKSLFENDGTEHIAMVMGNTNNFFASNTYSRSFTSAETFAAYLEAETEEPLHLEDWMVEETNFAMSAEIEAETESPLEIEDWMTNENNFVLNSSILETETEEELQLEDWMTNESNFTAAFKIETETENQLQVETWMTNESTFDVYSSLLETEIEEELVLENWMTDDNLFKISILKDNLHTEKAATKQEKENHKTVAVFSATNYGRRAFIIGTETDAKLKTESWMVNEKIWK